MADTSCPRPSYGRVLGSDLISGLAQVGFVAAGALGGYAIGKRSGDAEAVKGAFLGGAAGLVGGFYPTMMVQRATLRGPECPNPSMVRIFGYRAASTAAAALLGLGLRQVWPDKCELVDQTGPVPAPDGGTMVGYMGATEVCRPNFARATVAQGATLFGAPLLGQALLRSNGDN